MINVNLNQGLLVSERNQIVAAFEMTTNKLFIKQGLRVNFFKEHYNIPKEFTGMDVVTIGHFNLSAWSLAKDETLHLVEF